VPPRSHRYCSQEDDYGDKKKFEEKEVISTVRSVYILLYGLVVMWLAETQNSCSTDIERESVFFDFVGGGKFDFEEMW